MNVHIGYCTEKDLTSLKNMFHNVDSNIKCTHAIYSRLFYRNLAPLIQNSTYLLMQLKGNAIGKIFGSVHFLSNETFTLEHMNDLILFSKIYVLIAFFRKSM